MGQIGLRVWQNQTLRWQTKRRPNIMPLIVFNEVLENMFDDPRGHFSKSMFLVLALTVKFLALTLAWFTYTWKISRTQ